MRSFKCLSALLGVLLGWVSAPPARAAQPTLERAEALASQGDSVGAQAELESLAAREPANRQAWVRLATLRLAAGQARPAAEAFERALALKKDPFTMYNAACAYARLREVDKAFAWLEAAAGTGALPRRQFEQDEDLGALKADARFSALLEKAERSSEPCRFQPESAQFDFWLGQWRVHANGQSQHAGDSRIEKILGSCVLLENWTGPSGWSGKSFNIYDRDTKRWQQTWVDQSGAVTQFVDGEYRDGAMRFRTLPHDQNGERVETRMDFHDLGPDRVRQHVQSSKDGGKTWTDVYDFVYERVR